MVNIVQKGCCETYIQNPYRMLVCIIVGMKGYL